MNGHGTRWLERLSRTARWCPAGAPYLRASPCFVRSLSHGSRLLSRVRRRRSISAPVDAALDGPRSKGHLKQSEARPIARDTCTTDAPPHGKPQSWRGPIRELKDAEGRTYFTTGSDWSYHCRHRTSEESGHVKAAYTARGTYLNPSTKLLQYKKLVKNRPLLVMYFCDLVEDDEFWDESCVLCDFATAVTEREKSKEGCSPEKDSVPVEFIIVQARFHYNAARPDEPWHITVDFGNRFTWNNGDGFFRRGYHIYAKINDLSQGYAGYSSPVTRRKVGRIDPMNNSEYLPRSARNSAETGPSTSLDNTEATFWVPWGTREYYRNPKSRSFLHKTTHRSLIPPTVLSEARAQRTPEDGRKDKATGAWIWNPIQAELDDMVSCIRNGTSKPAIPSKGTFMVPGPSGDLVHVRQAVADFRKAGKKIPLGWRVVLGGFYASRHISEKTAVGPRETRARSAFDKTRRTTRTTTRSREGALKSQRLDGTGKSFRPKSKMRDSLDESLGVRQDRPGTEPPHAPGPQDGKLRASGRPESGSDTRKAGKKTGSPLPPAEADLVSESGKEMKGPHKAQRSRQTRAPKTTPAWALPRSKAEATSGEIHA